MSSFIAKPDSPVKWKHLKGFEIVLHDSDEWRLDKLFINGLHAGNPIVLFENAEVDYYFPDNGSSNTITNIKFPGPPPPMLPPANRSPEKSLSQDENYRVGKLLKHLTDNRNYYNGVVMLARHPNAIAMEFEAIPWPPTTMDDHVEPTPLDVFGSYVAYPLVTPPAAVDDTVVVDIATALNGTDPVQRQRAADRLAAMTDAERASVHERLPLASAKSERLITLPTRGVFAEGKLGHCNVSEEIDNTRFWKWDEPPFPVQAPDIAAVTPITPEPQAVGATPTAFPQSLVNIVNPTPAPDPAGLGAALGVLAASNIFRDMSGREQVADLLKTLSDNSVKIAEVAVAAQKAAMGDAGSGGASGGGGGSGGGSGPSQGGSTPGPQSPGTGGAGQAAGPAQPPGPPSQTPQQKESGNIDNARKRGEAAMAVLPPAKRKTVENRVQNDLQNQPAHKPKKIQIDLVGWGDKHIVGQWRVDLDQRGIAAGFLIETTTNAEGIIIVEVSNEYGDNRYTLKIAGEVLSGAGINAKLRAQNILLEFPPDKYRANDYLYVVLRASTDKFHTKASSSDEVVKKFSEHLGVSTDVGKEGVIKVTGEGGWTWEKEGKKTSTHEIEMDVFYYTGDFTVQSTA